MPAESTKKRFISFGCTGIADIIKQAIYSLKAGDKCSLIGLPNFGAEVSLIIGVLLHFTVLGITEGDSVPDVFIPQMVHSSLTYVPKPSYFFTDRFQIPLQSRPWLSGFPV